VAPVVVVDARPFIPDSGFGLAYVAGLVITAVIVATGKTSKARSLLVILIGNWLAVRGYVSGYLNFDYISLAIPAATSLAFCMAWRGIWGFGCVAATAIILVIEHLALIGVSFDAAAAMEDFCGYLTMVLIAYSSHRNGGQVGVDRFLSGYRRVRHSIVHFTIQTRI
jgi:hypothetical protein